MVDYGKLVIDAFEKLTPDLDAIYGDAKFSSTDNWLRKQKALVTGSGAAAMSIPGAHIALLTADVVFLMNRMSVCSYGVGAIYGYERFTQNLLEKEDFSNILALWAGDEEISTMVEGKVAVDIASKVGGKVGVKLIGKTIAKSSGVLIGKKLGGKVGAKVGAKFSGKLLGKAAGGFLPFLGPAVGGGINYWFISSISNSAEKYFDFKYVIANNL